MSYASWTTSHASQRGGPQDASRTRQDTPGCTRESQDLPGEALTNAPTWRALSPYGCSRRSAGGCMHASMHALVPALLLFTVMMLSFMVYEV
eukprot:194439-Chlamydomonas_euryale.AAC.1